MLRGTQTRLWLAAGAVSLAVHGVLAAGLGIGPQPSREAGGSQTSIAVLGDSDFDSLLAGELTPQEAAPISPDAASALRQEPAGEQIAALPGDAVLLPEMPAVREPAVRDGDAEKAVPELIEPESGLQELSLPQVVPVPVKRPEFVPQTGQQDPPAARNEPAQAAPPSSTGSRPARQQPARDATRRSGQGGDQTTSSMRGNSQAALQGGGAASTQRRAADALGNAQLANYAGMVRRKISSRFRPGGAGNGARDVIISFTVRNNGAASSLRVSRSSGNSDLDNAALAAVKAAAPFPPLPGGRDRLSVAVPLNVN